MGSRFYFSFITLAPSATAISCPSQRLRAGLQLWNDRAALRGGPDSASGLTLFKSKVGMIPGASTLKS